MSIDEKAFKKSSEQWLSEIRDVRKFVEAYEAAKSAEQPDGRLLEEAYTLGFKHGRQWSDPDNPTSSNLDNVANHWWNTKPEVKALKREISNQPKGGSE